MHAPKIHAKTLFIGIVEKTDHTALQMHQIRRQQLT